VVSAVRVFRLSARVARGFTYLTAIFLVGILAGGLALIGEMWHTASLREKEAELLFVGHQYRKAIERYYLAGPRQYPRTLGALLKDPRKPTTERYLRRPYVDPITGKEEWGVVKAPDGGIMGVYSLSDEAPLKTGNFRMRDREFEGRAKYSEWQFAFIVGSPTATKPDGAGSQRVGR
jgi:type II secretory pathway pseudopilin PulG